MKLEDRLGLIWLFLSALWVVGYLHAESLDGRMFEELGEVISITLLPPLLPPLIVAWAVRVFAGLPP
jgi:hypothetical protein